MVNILNHGGRLFSKYFSTYGTLLALGIILEAIAGPKPGNVHRYRCHEDKCIEDYVIAGLIASNAFIKGAYRGYRIIKYKPKILYMDLVKTIVFNSMRISGSGNTCLGTATLITPLSLAIGYVYGKGLEVNLNTLTATARDLVKEYSTCHDTITYYTILRKIRPSYLKKTDYTGKYPNIYDKSFKKTIIKENITLWEVLKFAATKDIVSRELVDGYKRSIDAVHYLENRLSIHKDWNRAIIETYLYLLSKYIDTIVMLKHGFKMAHYVKSKALLILETIVKDYQEGLKELEKFDQELQKDRVNPGAIADLVALTIGLYSIKKGEKIIHF